MSSELEKARTREETFAVTVTKKPATFSRRSATSKNSSAASGYLSSSSKRGLSSSKRRSSRLKKSLPVLAVALLVGLFAVGMFFAQSFLPVALVTRIREEYNNSGLSSILTSDALLDYQLSSLNSPYALSDLQRQAFSLNDIIPIDLDSPSPVTVLAFPSGRKEFSLVLPSSASVNISSVLATYHPSDLNFSGQTYSVKDALNTPAFKDRYTVASKQWRGGSSSWYDTLENVNEARLSISRTRYASLASLITSSLSHKLWKQYAAGTAFSPSATTSAYATFSSINEAGEEVLSTTSGTLDSASLPASTPASRVAEVLNSRIASVLQVASTAGCVGSEIATNLMTTIDSVKDASFLNHATGPLEAFDGQKAGLDGYPAAAEKYLDALTTPDPETGEIPVSSPGLSAFFSSASASTSDTDYSTSMTNLQSLLTTLGPLSEHISFTADKIKFCAYASLATSGISLATTALAFVPVLGQATAVLHVAARVVSRLALGVAVSAVVSFVVPKILDFAVANLTKNVATEWTGYAYGDALASGANKYLSSNFQIGGGAPASKEALLAYQKTKSEVLAAEAKTERSLRSPLDITSPHTFLGSLAYSFIPVATSSGFLSFSRALASLSKSSLAALLPSASAVAETDFAQSIGVCPELESAGLVGDALSCNPYYITDTSTLSATPEEIIEKVASLDPSNFLSINPDGTQEVNPDSPLGHHIKSCNKRLVPYGRASAEIASDLSTPSTGLLGTLTSLVPDLAQISSALSDLKNVPWISGNICGNSPENPRWDTEIKWYSAYETLQRNLENSGVLSRSSTYAVLEDYYQKNPLDNSPEGIIARFSGLEKSDVIASLGYLDALIFLAEYNPSSRLAFVSASLTFSSGASNLSRLSSAPRTVSVTYPALSRPVPRENALKLASAYAKINIIWKEKVQIRISRRLAPTVA